MQKNAVDDQDGIWPSRHPLRLEHRLVPHFIKPDEHETGTPARVEWVDQYATKKGVIIGSPVVSPAVKPTFAFTGGARLEEVVDVGSENLCSVGDKRLSHSVGEVSLPRSMPTVDGHERSSPRIVVQDFARNGFKFIFLLRCPSSHMPRVVR